MAEETAAATTTQADILAIALQVRTWMRYTAMVIAAFDAIALAIYLLLAKKL